MNEEMRKQAAMLRRMNSNEAADWLLSRYPLGASSWGHALTLLDHVSLTRQDIRRLAAHYLRQTPYPSDRPYRVFAKLLGLPGLLKQLETYIPMQRRDADLLMYHLRPMLDAAESDRDRNAASRFIAIMAAE
jgi:hypothetical protein